MEKLALDAYYDKMEATLYRVFQVLSNQANSCVLRLTCSKNRLQGPVQKRQERSPHRRLN